MYMSTTVGIKNCCKPAFHGWVYYYGGSRFFLDYYRGSDWITTAVDEEVREDGVRFWYCLSILRGWMQRT